MPGKVKVIGAGLAGCEAAFQIARQGVEVELIEQKPLSMSPAHSYAGLAELVCSNSLKSDMLSNAAGLLKAEMRALGSLILAAADATKVPAGGALAVDRYKFSDYITERIKTHPYIRLVPQEVKTVENERDIAIIATGPLTAGPLLKSIQETVGEASLYFFDAAAPIVFGESIAREKIFWGSRYDKGGDDYLNCPMTREEYDAFYQALVHADCVEQKGFEDSSVFEGCIPVEVMAKRGYQTLLFGPCKPVGLCEKGQKPPYAVVQLRREDADGRLFNIVGFQTHLKFAEQKRVFSMIPGLETAKFARLGVMHKNTYLNSPRLLDGQYRMPAHTGLYFAGQITGVEGYIESAASGLYAGICAAFQAKGKTAPVLSNKTAIGALAAYVSGSVSQNFQPMHITYGIIAEPEKKIRNRKEKRERIARASLAEIERFLEAIKL